MSQSPRLVRSRSKLLSSRAAGAAFLVALAAAPIGQAAETTMRLDFASQWARPLEHRGIGFVGLLDGPVDTAVDRPPAWTLEGGAIPQILPSEASPATPQGPQREGLLGEPNHGLALSLWKSSALDCRSGACRLIGYERARDAGAAWHVDLDRFMPTQEAFSAILPVPHYAGGGDRPIEPWMVYWDVGAGGWRFAWDVGADGWRTIGDGAGGQRTLGPADFDPTRANARDPLSMGSYVFWFATVKGIASSLLAAGQNPVWSVWNEPSGWGYIMAFLAPRDGRPPDYQLWHDNPYRNLAYTYHVAYLALRSAYEDHAASGGQFSVDDLTIAGPSTGQWAHAWEFLTGKSYASLSRPNLVLDLDTFDDVRDRNGQPFWSGFLDYASDPAHPLPLHGLTWHAFSDDGIAHLQGEFGYLSRWVLGSDHDGDGKADYASLGTTHFYINESVSHQNPEGDAPLDGFGSANFHLSPGHAVLAIYEAEEAGVSGIARACWRTRDTISFVAPSPDAYDTIPVTVAGLPAFAVAQATCEDHSLNDLLYVEYEGQAEGTPDFDKPVRYYRRPVYWPHYAYSDMAGMRILGETLDVTGKRYHAQAILGAVDRDHDRDGDQDADGWRYTVLLGASPMSGSGPDVQDIDRDGNRTEFVERFPHLQTDTTIELVGLPAVGPIGATRARLTLVAFPPADAATPWAPSEWDETLPSAVFDGRDGRPDGVPHNSPVLVEDGLVVQWPAGAPGQLSYALLDRSQSGGENRALKRGDAYYAVLEGFRLRGDLDQNGAVGNSDLARLDARLVGRCAYARDFDLDLDGDVDATDRAILVAEFTTGQTPSAPPATGSCAG